jgi:Sec-independent protein secretion pathway component TatC
MYNLEKASEIYSSVERAFLYTRLSVVSNSGYIYCLLLMLAAVLNIACHEIVSGIFFAAPMYIIYNFSDKSVSRINSKRQ